MYVYIHTADALTHPYIGQWIKLTNSVMLSDSKYIIIIYIYICIGDINFVKRLCAGDSSFSQE
jgi:hypothetical protein